MIATKNLAVETILGKREALVHFDLELIDLDFAVRLSRRLPSFDDALVHCSRSTLFHFLLVVEALKFEKKIGGTTWLTHLLETIDENLVRAIRGTEVIECATSVALPHGGKEIHRPTAIGL